MKQKAAFLIFISFFVLLVLSLPSHGQGILGTCQRTLTLRQEACPAFPSAIGSGGETPVTCHVPGSSGGGSLIWQELDYDLKNVANLCYGPGLYTWPNPSSGYLKSDASGILTIIPAGVSPLNTPGTTSQWISAYDSSTGTFTKTQPAFSNISGTATSTQGGTGLNTSASSGVPKITSGTWSINAGIADLASSTSANLRSVLSDETGSGAAVFATSPTLTNTTVNQAANGDTVHTSTRATDSSPTGNFELFKSASGSTLWGVDITGTLSAGTVPVARVTGLATSATTDTTNGNNISSGTIGTARLGSGTANNTVFLRGDQTWASPSATVTGGWDVANKSTVDQNVTSGSLVDVTGLTYSIPSTGTYEYESLLIMTSATNSGNEAGLGYTGNGTVAAMAIGHSSTAQTVVGGAVSFAASGSQAGGTYCTATSQTCVVWFFGTLTASTTGTFSVKMDRLGGSGTSVAKAGSTLKVRKIN